MSRAVHAPAIGLRERNDLILNADRGLVEQIEVDRDVAAEVELAALDARDHARDLRGERGLVCRIRIKVVSLGMPYLASY